MPRSGTTLVEQVLASHPQVHGAGELHDVHRIFQALPEIRRPARRRSLRRPVSVSAAIPREPRQAGILSGWMRWRLRSAARVVDKMPDNIRYLGLIAVLWPGARVIVCNRDYAISRYRAGKPTSWRSDGPMIGNISRGGLSITGGSSRTGKRPGRSYG